MIVVRPRRLPAGLACAAILAAGWWGEAVALEGDRIRPSVGLVYSYTDNIYYLDDRQSGAGLLRNGQRGDQTIGLRAGLDLDHYYSRQVFSLRSSLTNNRNQTYDQLDYTAYNLRGVWNWVSGERWDGDAGIEKTQVASTVYDFSVAQRALRNLRTQDSYFASGMLRMAADWKLRGAVRYNDIANSQSRFQTQNLEEWVLEGGSRRYSKANDDFLGVNFRYADGRYPNRLVVSGSVIDNAYRQYTAEAVIDYRYSGLTRVSGNVGFTNRQYAQFAQRNFSGLTGRLSLVYDWSSKTQLTGEVFREIGAWEDVTNNYVLTQGLRAVLQQSLTDKLALQVSYSLRDRSFLGDRDVTVANLPTRRDRLQSYAVGATWQPSRNISFNTSLSYDTRAANDAWAAVGFGPFNDFSVTTLSASGQLTF